MFAEPRQTRLNGGRLKLGCHHTRGHSGIVNFNDSGQVAFDRVANDQIHGLRFFTAACAEAGELDRLGVERGEVVADGVATGNANVGDGDAAGVSPFDKADCVGLGDDKGVDVGEGVGEGGIMFSQ